MFRRHARLIALASVVALAGVLVVHAASQPPAPGTFISWSGSPPGAEATPSAVAGVRPVPAASPTPASEGGPFGGLSIPLSGLFHQLNSETKASATGQYSILQELENALRDRIDQFLNWVTGRH